MPTNRPLSGSFNLDDEDTRTYREDCNTRSGNTADFRSVPTERIFEYRGKCYDLEPIINYFKNNLFRLDFFSRLTILISYRSIQ